MCGMLLVGVDVHRQVQASTQHVTPLNWSPFYSRRIDVHMTFCVWDALT